MANSQKWFCWKIRFCGDLQFLVRTQNYKWHNGKQYKGKRNMVQSALAQRMRQGCTGPPPPLTPLQYRVAACIKNFAKLRKRKFRSSPTPTQSAVCYSPSPPICKKILQSGTAMLLWDEDEYGTVLFHSVIFNSVTVLYSQNIYVHTLLTKHWYKEHQLYHDKTNAFNVRYFCIDYYNRTIIIYCILQKADRLL